MKLLICAYNAHITSCYAALFALESSRKKNKTRSLHKKHYTYNRVSWKSIVIGMDNQKFRRMFRMTK